MGLGRRGGGRDGRSMLSFVEVMRQKGGVDFNMPEVKDIIYYAIYSIGIMVTCFLSYMIYRATKQSIEISKVAVEATKQSAIAAEIAAEATTQATKITEIINKGAINAQAIKEYKEKHRRG